MNTQLFLSSLQTKVYGQDLYYYEIINSTNTKAIQMVSDDCAQEGTIVIAGTQTAGRGTSGNKWESPTAKGIYLSLVTYEPLKQTPLAFVPGIAFAKCLNETYGIKAHLKWPNDILVGEKKIGGILCESSHSNNKKAWIVGVGLNVNQTDFPEVLAKKAISMCQVSGNNYVIDTVIQNFLVAFEDLFLSDCEIVQEWKKYSTMIDKLITAKKGGLDIQVKVIDVTTEGFLLVQHENGEIEEWYTVHDLDISTSY